MVRARASELDLLRHRDVADLTPAERALLAALFATIRPVAPRRRALRRRRDHRGDLDMRRTLREELRRGGEVGPIRFRRTISRPRRVVLLIDVSGSMSAYADTLLRCAHVWVRAEPRHTEVFTIGTRLTRLTRALRARDAEAALRWRGSRCRTGPAAPGSERCSSAFPDRWGQRGMARGAVLVIFSDGWERGDVALLAEQMHRLRVARSPGGVGQPASGQGGLPSGAERHHRSHAVPGRSARRSFAGDVRRPRGGGSRCVRYSMSCSPGGARTARSGWPPWSPPGARRPARAGAAMLLGPDGEAVGSVSGGCVEGAVYELSGEVVATGVPVLQRYGVSDDDAFAVGLTCGGILDVFVERVDAQSFPRARRRSPPTSTPVGRSPSARSSSTRTRRSGGGSSSGPEVRRIGRPVASAPPGWTPR